MKASANKTSELRILISKDYVLSKGLVVRRLIRLLKRLNEHDRPRTEGFIARRLGKEVSLQLQQLVKEGKVHKTRHNNQ